MRQKAAEDSHVYIIYSRAIAVLKGYALIKLLFKGG